MIWALTSFLLVVVSLVVGLVLGKWLSRPKSVGENFPLRPPTEPPAIRVKVGERGGSSCVFVVDLGSTYSQLPEGVFKNLRVSLDKTNIPKPKFRLLADGTKLSTDDERWGTITIRIGSEKFKLPCMIVKKGPNILGRVPLVENRDVVMGYCVLRLEHSEQRFVEGVRGLVGQDSKRKAARMTKAAK